MKRWTYEIETGALYLGASLVGLGYSGHGEGKNCVHMEAVHDVGPIPRGSWEIVGPPFDSPGHGPYVLRLLPLPGTETFGRGGFLLHGDSKSHPGEASRGCIVQARGIREAVWQSGIRRLEVLSAESPTADAA